LQEGILPAREKCWRNPVDQPRLARTNFFYARALKEDGEYDDAIVICKSCSRSSRATVLCATNLAAFCFWRSATRCGKGIEQTLSIDPEDLQAHYNLMLCYNGLGNDAKANEHKARYLRFRR